MEANKEDTMREDTTEDIFTATPVVLRNKRNKNSQRTKKCFSVIVEPSHTSGKYNNVNNNNFRQSMFELGTDGWILDKLNENGSMKNVLNLDKEIDNILDVNSSADVILGNIRLTF